MAFRTASRLSRLRRAFLAALALTLTVAWPARADSTKDSARDDAKQEAKAHFTSGQSHYNLNEYAEALAEFKAAYRIFPDPVFLYNLAQCERRLGHYEEAISFYRSYLREQPRAANRQDVQHKIEEMEAAQKGKTAETERSLVPPAAGEPGDANREPKPAPPAAPEIAAGQPGAESTKIQPQPAASPTAEARAGAGSSEKAPTSAAPARPAPALSSTPAPPDESSPSSGVDLTSSTTPVPAGGQSPAFYQRWWFWTAIGVVAAGAGVGVYLVSGQGASAPHTALGSRKVF